MNHEQPETRVRRARADEVETVVELIRLMVMELAALGHDAISREAGVWERMDERIRSTIDAADHLMLLMEEVDGSGQPIGFLEARLEELAFIFAPETLLHVSAVYIVPPRRRRGLARLLLSRALDWGREQGCKQARLRSLVENPARRLYSSLGFRAFQVEMRRAL